MAASEDRTFPHALLSNYARTLCKRRRLGRRFVYISAALWNFRISHFMSSSAQVAPAIPDDEIVRRFQQTGSSDCFAELFARHRRRVFMACRSFFSDKAAAEDATQETFLHAYRKIHSFQGGNFQGWLMRIARNACIDLWRKRRPELGAEDELQPEGHATGAGDKTPDLRWAVEEVWNAMTTLPPDQRRCLEMKIQGYSYEETAVQTGFSVEAVKSHLQNGRRTLWLKTKGISQLR
jgi:RNA polymerase sigma factor (sigma-70 family)